ncbi:MAG: hypothetical protein HFE66_08365 [Clostridiales bacterium]|jgi:hypothetical protein|nr:hypothetical protein [Clostridiales bacterium]
MITTMTENLRVSCLINPRWDISSKSYIGDAADYEKGTLIGLSSEIYDGSMTVVGVVILDTDSSLQTIPIQFITKITE